MNALSVNLLPFLPGDPVAPGLRCAIEPGGGMFRCRYSFQLTGAVSWPEPAPAGRADELWRTTCCELFLAPADGSAYLEFNFSPSGAWQVYRFDDCRSGMREATDWTVRHGSFWLTGTRAELVVEVVPGITAPLVDFDLGVSAVVASPAGTAWFAHRHPAGRPDFHDRSCYLGVHDLALWY